jgi:hypothetical protein
MPLSSLRFSVSEYLFGPAWLVGFFVRPDSPYVNIIGSIVAIAVVGICTLIGARSKAALSAVATLLLIISVPGSAIAWFLSLWRGVR